ncbi:MAG: hypothetical protein VKS61_16545 [Candidatus Sericytochromatia bacterium]|nr:hypothetical protein [Candidatus Sericytochromatia bacterium]
MRRLVGLALAAGLAAAGCGPAARVAAPVAGLTVPVAAEAGPVRLTVAPRLLGRRLLGLVEPHAPGDVARLVISLHRRAGGVTGPALAEVALTDPATLQAPLVFEGLRRWTTYVVRGTAHDAAGAVISEAAHSEVAVAVAADEALAPVALTVSLLDRPFSAAATWPAVAVSPGSEASGIRGVVTTLAGVGFTLAEEGLGRLGKEQPEGSLAVGPDGTLYVADTELHRIKRIAPDGRGATLAGSGKGDAGLVDGVGWAARFNRPKDLVLAPDGTLYVADTDNHCIRVVSPDGAVTTLAGGVAGFADGVGAAAAFSSPSGIALAATGEVLVGDTGNHCIRAVSTAGVVTTVAGTNASGYADATGAAARFSGPRGLAVAPDGAIIVADTGNHRLRRIASDGAVTTLAGSGQAGHLDATGLAAKFNAPRDLAVDATGNVLVADTDTRRVRHVTPAGAVTTLAGSGTSGLLDGVGTAVQWRSPSGLALAPDGSLRVFDQGGIRAIVDRRVFTVVPSGIGSANGASAAASFYHPYGLVAGPDGSVYVADNYNLLIRKVAPDGTVSTLAGSTYGATDGTGAAAKFAFPDGLAIGPDGSLYVGDRNNHRIRRVTTAGVVTTLAGAGTAGSEDGAASVARFNTPRGVAVASDGTVYVADTANHRVRRVTPAGEVTTLAGSTAGFADGIGAAAQFSGAWGITLADDATLLVADSLNHRIRRVSTGDGAVTTVSGAGVPGTRDGAPAVAEFNTPTGLVVGRDGAIYVTDSGNHRLRRIGPDGQVTTVAGSEAGAADGVGAEARFHHPRGIALAPDGSLLVADRMNHAIRVVR